MADLGSGRTVAKSVARAQLEGVDASPTGFFRQSPVWSEDPAIRSYVNTCQGTRVGDAIRSFQFRQNYGTCAAQLSWAAFLCAIILMMRDT